MWRVGWSFKLDRVKTLFVLVRERDQVRTLFFVGNHLDPFRQFENRAPGTAD